MRKQAETPTPWRTRALGVRPCTLRRWSRFRRSLARLGVRAKPLASLLRCGDTPVLFNTNAIESLHARYRRAITVRGHFPTEQAALKTLYMVTRGPGPQRHRAGMLGGAREPAHNAFAVTLADRMSAAENL